MRLSMIVNDDKIEDLKYFGEYTMSPKRYFLSQKERILVIKDLYLACCQELELEPDKLNG